MVLFPMIIQTIGAPDKEEEKVRQKELPLLIIIRPEYPNYFEEEPDTPNYYDALTSKWNGYANYVYCGDMIDSVCAACGCVLVLCAVVVFADVLSTKSDVRLVDDDALLHRTAVPLDIVAVCVYIFARDELKSACRHRSKSKTCSMIWLDAKRN